MAAGSSYASFSPYSLPSSIFKVGSLNFSYSPMQRQIKAHRPTKYNKLHLLQLDYWFNLLVSLKYMLKKVGEDWHFASENNLEDFVWSQFNSLFELSPLKRQYTASGAD
jgi:hypothetical protein